MTASGRDLLRLEGDDTHSLPDIGDLAARLRFSPRTGHIWLDDRRMVLMHTRAQGILRRELIDTLGLERARALLTRMGYESGAMDAELANKVRGRDAVFDAFSVGPQLHALEGIVYVEPLVFDVDVTRGRFYAEYLWHDSFEDEVHIEHYGIGADPVCWTQIGYACGYSTVFMGRPVIFREVECRAMGHARCRIVGKLAEDWDDPEEDLKYLRADHYLESAPLSLLNKETYEHDGGRRISAVYRPHGGGKSPATRKSPAVPRAGAAQEDEEDRWKMVGASASFNVAYHMLQRVAQTSATVLFLGESGVGKEMFARTLHRLSARADQPFIALNCAAIPESLIEAELFGVEKGAFTGATQSRPGRFERAQNGTLFLDEVGQLTLSAQGKLLRALQEGEIERVGDTRTRQVDVRVVAATNVDLKEAVGDGRFREDLYFRLNVFPIHIPPLRERKADIPLLLNRFLKRFSRRHGKQVTGFTERAIAALLNYDWPGNIRELENMVERGIILVENGGALDICHLFTSGEQIDTRTLALSRKGTLDPEALAATAHTQAAMTVNGNSVDALARELVGRGVTLQSLEEELLKAAVEKTNGNLSAAARMLGMTRPQLAYRLKKLDEKDQLEKSGKSHS